MDQKGKALFQTFPSANEIFAKDLTYAWKAFFMKRSKRPSRPNFPGKKDYSTQDHLENRNSSSKKKGKFIKLLVKKSSSEKKILTSWAPLR